MIQTAGATSHNAQPSWEIKGKKIDGVKIVEKERKEWNTKNIGSRVAVDAACAATAGGVVSPIITMIDKYVLWRIGGVEITELTPRSGQS